MSTGGVSAPTAAGRDASAVPATVRGGHALPFSLLLGVFSGLAILSTARGPFRDVDLFWHLKAGQELAQGTRPDGIGRDWSVLAPVVDPWISTQWLAEWIFFRIHEIGSWTALAAWKTLTAAAAIALLARCTLAGRSKALAGLPFIAAALPIALVSQARPQQVTLVGAALLGGVLFAGLREKSLPPWFVVLPATALWANMHGGWVLVPAGLGLVALGSLIDDGVRASVFLRGSALALLSLLGGMLTPSGAGGMASVRRFSQAADGLAEWQSTQPAYSLGIFTTSMLILLSVGWARMPTRVPRSEVLVGLACLIFSWTAWRNVAPGLALLAPLVADRLCLAYPSTARRERNWAPRAGVAIAVALTMVGLVRIAGTDQLPSSTQPLRLAASIAQMEPGQRVLNHYRAAGVVLYFGGDGTRVAIDGRADRYGAETIRAYLDMMDLKGDWETVLGEVDPTVALIEEDTALTHMLLEERGWTTIGRENGFVLLLPRAEATP